MDETDTTTMDFGRLSFGERKNKKKYVYINCKTCPGIYVKRHVSNKSKFYRRPSDSKLFEHIATIEGKEFYKKKEHKVRMWFTGWWLSFGFRCRTFNQSILK